jgi:hypothetical protein
MYIVKGMGLVPVVAFGVFDCLPFRGRTGLAGRSCVTRDRAHCRVLFYSFVGVSSLRNCSQNGNFEATG